MKFVVLIEKSKTGYSAYSPDLPGCVSSGMSEAEVLRNMREAMEFHIEGLKAEGQPIPEPATKSSYVEVAS
jgi:predicted RNase H-like HicB family nuclease